MGARRPSQARECYVVTVMRATYPAHTMVSERAAGLAPKIRGGSPPPGQSDSGGRATREAGPLRSASTEGAAGTRPRPDWSNWLRSVASKRVREVTPLHGDSGGRHDIVLALLSYMRRERVPKRVKP